GDAEDARGSPGAQHRLSIIMDQRDPRCTAERRGPLAASSPPASAVPASDERLEDLPALEQLERVVELRVGAELAFLDVDGALARRAARGVVALGRCRQVAVALRVPEVP